MVEAGGQLQADVFSLLSRPVRMIVQKRGFESATGPQAAAIPLISEGKNVLLIAPTGTGKTEAAFLPILDLLLKAQEKLPGIKVLYITPLRALNRDMLERLEWWCKQLDVRIAVRHGDTETRERGFQARSPPDLLITTPETLQAILPGRVMRRHLRSVRWVIVDECHELAEDKRGSQLTLALERLRWITGQDFQVVGLSATIGTPERVAKFLVGVRGSVEIVRVPVARNMEFKVLYPEPAPEDYELAAKLYTHPEVAARLRIMRDLIEKHSSVLLFTNTRPIAEVLASRFKIWDVNFPVSIHHGSLAKPARVSAERGLKNGELRGLVCTSSLELGIDVGSIDLCIQYMSPRQVTRLLQRVGRSGHRIGRTAKGIIITMDSDDTLEAMVIARRAKREELEPIKIPEHPYDALCHQIAGLLAQKGRWYLEEVLQLFGNAYPYEGLRKEELEKVLHYMHSRYPRLAWYSPQDQVILRPMRTKQLYEYYFEKLSMIPEEKQYLVIDETSETPVGILDEAFVAEYGEPGTKFILRGSPYKILNILGDRIYVKPIDDPTGAIPSWIGEEIPVPYEVAMEVGRIRRCVAEHIKGKRGLEDILSKLGRLYPIDKEDLARALRETVAQAEAKLPVPSDRLITIEEWQGYIIIHAHFGSLVNRTLARLIGHVLSERIGYTIGVQQDPYRIIIEVGGRASPKDVERILKELPSMPIEELAIAATTKTGLFKRRLVHVARRFGALKRSADFSRVSLSQLQKSFEGTVIYEEAIKETLRTDMDLEATLEALKAIQRGRIKIKVIETGGNPTPIANIGIERIARKSDLIPPEKMRRVLIESAKVRLLSEVRTFVCMNCLAYVKTMRIMDLSPKPLCPNCGSQALGIFSETEEGARKILEKMEKNLSSKEKRILSRAQESAKLIEAYGLPAALALVGRRLEVSEASEILRKEPRISDRFFELIIEAEKKAMGKRFL
ncbi:MAG: DEAD/DEAH box helicase [Candidatus Bathyarchaeia archaeon]